MKINRLFVLNLTLLLSLNTSANQEQQCEKNKALLEPPRFSVIDQNNNGSITLKEFKQHQISHKRFEKMFMSIDTDNNGAITVEEFKAHKPKRLKKKSRNCHHH